MRAIRNQKFWWIIGILAAILFLFVIPRVDPPPPQVDSYFISAGGVSRATIQEKSKQRTSRLRSRGFGRTFLPHHLEFKSTGGSVDVYVVRFPSGSPREQVDEMTRLTEDLKKGRPPKRAVAKGSGDSGRIDLHSWGSGGVMYLVLVRSENDSDVTLVTHYGP